MRSRFLLLLAFFCMTTAAWPGESTFFQKQLVAYMTAHVMDCPEDVRHAHRPIEATLAFTLDRDGKLSDAKIEKGTGLAKVDQALLTWLTNMQPYPTIPRDENAPHKALIPVRFVTPASGAGRPESYQEHENRIKRMIGNVCKGC
jgi:TonB family protein